MYDESFLSPVEGTSVIFDSKLVDAILVGLAELESVAVGPDIRCLISSTQTNIESFIIGTKSQQR